MEGRAETRTARRTGSSCAPAAQPQALAAWLVERGAPWTFAVHGCAIHDSAIHDSALPCEYSAARLYSRRGTPLLFLVLVHNLMPCAELWRVL